MDTTESMATIIPDMATITIITAPCTSMVATMARGMTMLPERIPLPVPNWVHRQGSFSTRVTRSRRDRSRLCRH